MGEQGVLPVCFGKDEAEAGLGAAEGNVDEATGLIAKEKIARAINRVEYDGPAFAALRFVNGADADALTGVAEHGAKECALGAEWS